MRTENAVKASGCDENKNAIVIAPIQIVLSVFINIEFRHLLDGFGAGKFTCSAFGKSISNQLHEPTETVTAVPVSVLNGN